MGKQNGAYTHGGWTSESIDLRRRAVTLLRVLKSTAS